MPLPENPTSLSALQTSDSTNPLTCYIPQVLRMTSYLHILGHMKACQYRLQRVTSLRRYAQANAPTSSYWLRHVLDDG